MLSLIHSLVSVDDGKTQAAAQSELTDQPPIRRRVVVGTRAKQPRPRVFRDLGENLVEQFRGPEVVTGCEEQPGAAVLA